MPPDGPGRLDIAVCEKHGLRYNRSVERGCALCRREAGTTTGAATPASRVSSPTAPPAARPTPRPAPPPQADPLPPRPQPQASQPVPDAAVPAPTSAASGRSVDIVVCEKHRLRYNRAAESGCVRCRRESGLGPAAANGTIGAAAARSSGQTEAPASAAVQLLVAALLVGGTGTLFWTVQKTVLESFAGGALATAGKEGAEAAAAPAARKSFQTTDPFDPAAIPTPEVDPGGHGPGEEQKQIHEFFEQMKEEEAKERGNAPPAEPQ